MKRKSYSVQSNLKWNESERKFRDMIFFLDRPSNDWLNDLIG